ncbi:MAG: PAS domain-containing protein [Candidatus Omnitrophica bacterium]|nr:PAS domain-containing protein [Candidatus Omnitrophota bacterium]
MVADLAALIAELRSILGKLEVALGSIDTGVVWTDSKGRVQWCNRGFDRITGRAHIEILGIGLEGFLPLSRDGRLVPPEAHPLRLIMTTGVMEREAYQLKRGDEVLSLEIEGSRFHLSEREEAAILLVQDVTERARSLERERELAQSAALSEQKRLAELERAQLAALNVMEDLELRHKEIETREKKLQETMAMLVQAEKLQSVGRLAAGVAHEVKNPLSVIRMGADFLAKRIGEGDPDARQVIEDISDAVRKADTVIRGILDFSSLSAVSLKQDDLHAVLEASISLVRHELERLRVKVVRNIAKEPLLALMDRNRVQHVLVNLILNASHAMGVGGTLTVRAYTQKIGNAGAGKGRREGDRFKAGETLAVLEIDDTGPGIPEEHLSKIFDPFFTTKKTGQGTGLGLSIAKNIMDMHGGELNISNRRGGGVRATLIFKT